MAFDPTKYGLTSTTQQAPTSSRGFDPSAYGLTTTSVTPTAAPAAVAPQPNIAQRIWGDITQRASQFTQDLGATPDIRNPSQVLSAGLKPVADVFGGVTDVAGELINSNRVTRSLAFPFSDAYKRLTDKLASTKLFTEAAQGLQPNNNLENYLSAAKSAGDIANSILVVDQARAAAVKTQNALSKLPSSGPRTLSTNTTSVNPQTKQIDALTKEWQRPIETPTASFNKARQVTDRSPQTPQFLAQQGIDPRAYLEDGRYSFGDTPDALRTTAGQLSRDTLRPSLQLADYGTSPTPVGTAISDAIKRVRADRSLTPADTDTAITALQKEALALEAKYPNGMSLTDMHDEGITFNQNGGYRQFAPAADNLKASVNRALGSVLKDLVEKNAPSSIPVGEFNKYLSQYYRAADYLEALNTKKAPITFTQALTRGVFKYGGAALGEGLGHGVVSAFAGYSIGRAIEHALENLTPQLRGMFIRNIETTNPEAFTRVQSFLDNYNSGVPALGPGSFIAPTPPSEPSLQRGRALQLQNDLPLLSSQADATTPAINSNTNIPPSIPNTVNVAPNTTAPLSQRIWDITASKPSKAVDTSTGNAPIGKEGVSAQRADTSGPFEGGLSPKQLNGRARINPTEIGSLSDAEIANGKSDHFGDLERLRYTNRPLEDQLDAFSRTTPVDYSKNKNGELTVYRVVPKGQDITAGDFVFTDKAAAERFMAQYGKDRNLATIAEKRVSLDQMIIPGRTNSYGDFNSPSGELIYLPKGASRSPSIPKELEPLAKEAQKYSSAEEFVKALSKKEFRYDDTIAGIVDSNYNAKIGTIPFDELNKIEWNQGSVDPAGVRKWLKRIQAGERPYVMLDFNRGIFGDKPVPRIIDGHTRFEAYRDAGIKDVPVIDRSGKVLPDGIGLTDFYNKVKGKTK